MSLIGLIIAIALAGFICYLITLIPMPPIFRQIIMGLIVVVVVLWLLQEFGVGIPYGPHIRLR